MLIYCVIHNSTNKYTDMNNDNNINNGNSSNNNVMDIEFDLRALRSHICRKNKEHKFVDELGACFFKHLCL